MTTDAQEAQLRELGVITEIGNVRVHVAPVAIEVAERWELRFIWGAPGRGTGDHARGTALDFMTYSGGTVKRPTGLRHQVGEEIAEHLLDHRERLNVAYVIYDHRIASAKSSPPWSWRPYDGTNPHTDHVHASFRGAGHYQPEDDMPTPQEYADAVRVALAPELDKIAAFDIEAYQDTTAKLNTFEERERARDAKQDEALARLEAAVAALAGTPSATKTQASKEKTT